MTTSDIDRLARQAFALKAVVEGITGAMVWNDLSPGQQDAWREYVRPRADEWREFFRDLTDRVLKFESAPSDDNSRGEAGS